MKYNPFDFLTRIFINNIMKIFLRISFLLWYLFYSYITNAQILTQETFSGGQTGFLLASDGVITNKNTKVDVDKNSYNKVFV